MFTRSRLAPTIAASSSWVTGQREGVGVARELEQALGGAGGDVEEDRVGQRLVGGAQPLATSSRTTPHSSCGRVRSTSYTGS